MSNGDRRFRHLRADYAAPRQLAGRISRATEIWINHNRRVPELLAQPPVDPGLRY